MSGKGVFLFVLAVILAGAAAWLANTWVQSRAGVVANTEELKTVKVVMAALPIPYSDQIESADLKVVDWPEDYAPEGYVADPKDVEGKLALMEMTTGDVVSKAKFADKLDGSRLAALIDEGKRAMSVRVDDVVGVAGFILPGNRVDILGVKNVGSGRGNAVVETVVNDVRVLAIDQDVSPTEEKAKIVRAVTLEVTDHQSKELVKAMSEGKIHLTLRNPLDRYAQAPKPAPKPRVPVKRVSTPKPKITEEPFKVQVIRGTSLTEEKPREHIR